VCGVALGRAGVLAHGVCSSGAVRPRAVVLAFGRRTNTTASSVPFRSEHQAPAPRRAFCASHPTRPAVPGLQGCRHLCHSCSGHCGARGHDPSDCGVWRALCPHAVSCWRVKAARHGSLGRRDRPCPRAAVGRGIGVRWCVMCTVESDVM